MLDRNAQLAENVGVIPPFLWWMPASPHVRQEKYSLAKFRARRYYNTGNWHRLERLVAWRLPSHGYARDAANQEENHSAARGGSCIRHIGR